MGLFRRKKVKKYEEINITFEEHKFEDDIIEVSNESNILKEEEEIQSYSNEELEKNIISKFKLIEQKNEKIIKDYFTCKILSRVGLKDLDFNLQVVAMDKHVNRIKKDCFDLSRVIENINSGLKLEGIELVKLNKQLDDLKAFQRGLQLQLNEIQNSSYSQLKISTVSVTLNKSNDELEKLYNNIALELKPFKSFDEASEYIFYNSGDYIYNLVDTFVTYIKGLGNKDYIELYTHKYFIESDVVISLEIKEWVELYNKLKLALRFIGNYDELNYKKYLTMFDKFEARYAILMMRTETKNN